MISEIIQKYNIKAKKSLGQNFLTDHEILNDIGNITSINCENIIEVGPGFGVLTEIILAKNPKSLTLVELDHFMIKVLHQRIHKNELIISHTDFQIIQKDILEFTPTFFPYKVIANIPYYITSPILYRFLYELSEKPTHMVILMQKEVAERIVGEKSSVLSLLVAKKSYSYKKIFVGKTAFTPAPKVDSMVLYLESHDIYNDIDDNIFLSFIKKAFSQPRKKLINNLSLGGYNKEKILVSLYEKGFGENTRPEELSVQDYIYMIKQLCK